MHAVFIESKEFTEWVVELLPDDTYSLIQTELMKDPDKGDVIPGCGGLRKLRCSDPKRHKGKRGGARIIYLYVPEAKWFLMLDIYDKDEQDDLGTDEKKFLAKLAQQFKQDAKAAAKRSQRRTSQ